MLVVTIVVKGRGKAPISIDKLNVPRSDILAVTHIDYSARTQSVHLETNPRFHALLSTSKQKTGCPALVNTSFNVHGEPIVRTPEDTFRCFKGTELDALAVVNLYLQKSEQNSALKSRSTRLGFGIIWARTGHLGNSAKDGQRPNTSPCTFEYASP